MFRAIFKLALAAAVLFAAYKGASIYSLFQFAQHMRECLPASNACRLVELKAPQQDVQVAMGQALSCVRQRQTSVESVFLSIPKAASTSSSEPVDYNRLQEMCKDWGRASPGARK